MKIAVLGSAGSLPKAPFRNSEFDKYAQGRAPSPGLQHAQVEGDWDTWCCSPGAWSASPRITRFFEVHRWEPGAPWFSPEYCQFLRDFKGPVYTGGVIPEIPNAVLYPIDHIEEKFSSYFLTSSLALMMALAIDEIEQIRRARLGLDKLPAHISTDELAKPDSDDVIGLWGVDMAANEEYAYQRPGCQFFIIEALRRGIGVYVPPESDLMRPMPVYGISEWDHNYIKLTTRSREMNASAQEKAKVKYETEMNMAALQGEMHALEYFVKTWCSKYGMHAGMIVRHKEGTGLGGGIVSLDSRPVQSIPPAPEAPLPEPLAQHVHKRKGNGAAAAPAG